MRPGQLALSVVLAVATGCATSSASQRETGPEDVARPEPAVAPAAPESRPAIPPLRRVAVHRATRAVVPARPPENLHGSLTLEPALRKFMAVRMVQPRRRAPVMTLDKEQTWHEFLSQVERAAARAPMDGQQREELSLFIRTRVSLEAEWELDQRRYKAMPEDLEQRWRDAISLVDERVRLLREESNGFALGSNVESPEPVTLRFPVKLVTVTSYFGYRQDPILRHRSRFHAGVDFGGAEGMLVSAAGPGVVAYADWQGANGNHVIVIHPHGYRTYYSHLSRIFVQPGMVVQEGTPLGVVGDTGRSTGPHLHFAVSRHGSFSDPLDALNVPLGPDGPPSS